MSDKKAEAFVQIAAVKPTVKGAEEEGIKHVQEFLHRFGYLKDVTSCTLGVLDDETSGALAKYQRCHALPDTGTFDEPTRDQMTTVRCAFPDMKEGIEFSTTCAWDKTDITYAFDTGTNDVAGDEEFQAIRNAFQTWAGVVALTFREVGVNDNPDVLIGWRPANDPDLNMQGGTLAHADFPPACGIITNTLPKPVHFDDTEHTWVIGAAPGAFDVETIALHEIGHILGLAHSNVNGSVMFPTVSANTTKRLLTPDDVSGIQKLYPPISPPPPPPGPGCFIATAAFESDIAPEVNFLRGIRDNVLRRMDWGRNWFDHFWRYYYRISPPIAEQMDDDPELRKIIRWSMIEPWSHYMKLLVARPDWDKIDFDGLDPQLRTFLLTLREDMDHWLTGIELPQSLLDTDPLEAAKELNVILSFVLRTGGMRYLDEQVERGELPLRYESDDEATLLDILRQAGRSEEEIQRILYGKRAAACEEDA